VGDRGVGALKQRVHGVVDIYGRPKPSYEVLRPESGPIESLSVENQLNVFHLLVRRRRDMPTYTLRGYRFRGVLYGEGDFPVEQQEAELRRPPPVPSSRLKSSFASRVCHFE
jgi:beta-glucuronidase